MTWLRSMMSRLRGRREARRQRKIETLQRRSAENYRDPPMNISGPGI